MSYPDVFLRGISDPGHIDEDGNVSSAVFSFGKKDNVHGREDNFDEESIFWKDDEGAVAKILNQTKADGKIQFRAGAAEVDRTKVDHVRKLFNYIGVLEYERKTEENNPYHGNLLLKKNIKKIMKNNISGLLANCVVGTVKNEK